MTTDPLTHLRRPLLPSNTNTQNEVELAEYGHGSSLFVKEDFSLTDSNNKPPDISDPARWAITFQQLLDVQARAKQKYGLSYHWKNMRDITEDIVIPSQSPGKSYALSINENGHRVGAFITHCWDEPFGSFVDSIRSAFQHHANRDKPNLWICAFALLQGDKTVVSDLLEAPEQSPFVRALKKATYFVVVRNSKTDLYSRIWCVCELMYAKKFGFTTSKNKDDELGEDVIRKPTMVIGPNSFSKSETSCVDAEASDPKDKEKILELLQNETTVEEVDELVREYRRHRKETSTTYHRMKAAIVFVVVAVVVAAVVFSVQSPESNPISTLEKVTKAGILRCGFPQGMQSWRYGVRDGDYTKSFCRAYASAILGDGDKMEVVRTDPNHQFNQLAKGEIDFLFLLRPMSMIEDIAEWDTGQGFTFSPPFIGSIESRLTGVPKYVDCFQSRNFEGECSDMRLCLFDDPTKRQYDGVFSWFPNDKEVTISSPIDFLKNIVRGECQVGFMPETHLLKKGLKMSGYEGEIKFGYERIFGSGGTVVTADGDPQWSDTLNFLLFATVAAEQANITQDMAQDFGQTDLFGDGYEDMFINMIEAIGNYDEIWKREIGEMLPRTAANRVNDGSTGLIAPYPISDSHKEAPRKSGGTLAAIKDRGNLICAARRGRPGFADLEGNKWQGLDIDYCRALAASIFGDVSDSTLIIKEVGEQSDGFVQLDKKTVDVMAGATWTVRNDVRERTTGVGFSFSQPYFYAPVGSRNSTSYDENLCLATRQDDQHWSSFVFWLVTSTFAAEDVESHSSMPEVNLFGSSFSSMFRDAIQAVGDYGEIYNRNLATILPRSGRNQRLIPKYASPMLYVTPGYRFR